MPFINSIDQTKNRRGEKPKVHKITPASLIPCGKKVAISEKLTVRHSGQFTISGSDTVVIP